MAMSDPIADMLTRIRNANTAKHEVVEIPASNMKKAIAQILLMKDLSNNYEVVPNGQFENIKLTLKYSGKDKRDKEL